MEWLKQRTSLLFSALIRRASISSAFLKAETNPNLGDRLKDRIYFEQVKYSQASAKLGYLAHILAITLVIIAVGDVVPTTHLLTWAAIIIATIVFRSTLTIFYQNAAPVGVEIKRWHCFFIIGSALTGAAWGVGALILLPVNSNIHQVIMLLALGAVTTGAVATLSPSLRIFCAFFVPALLPVTFWFLIQNSKTYVLMGLTLVVVGSVLVVTARRLRNTIMESLRLRFENVNLIESLSTANVNVEAANRQLEKANFMLAEDLKARKLAEAEMQRAKDAAEQAAVELRVQTIALTASEERFRSSFDYASIGMALVSCEGRWLKVNRSLCDIVGYGEQALLMADFSSLTHADDLNDLLAKIEGLMADETQNYCQTEIRYLHKKGHVIWASCNVAVVREENGNVSHLIFQVQDVTARKSAEQQLLHDALHDALTGLANRALFKDRLDLCVERAKRNKNHLFAVLFLDLDRFKYVNDSFGHMAGDQLLIEIARRLQPCFRSSDMFARLGGDEFTVLLDGLCEFDEAFLVADRIREQFSRPFTICDHEIFTSASIGIATSANGFQLSDDLMRNADTAMYRAKALGKSRCEIFDQSMHDAAKSTLFMETELRHAIEREEFSLHFQPIMALATGRINGFEALIRWQHPQHGLIAPNEFIPVAEETGLIIQIGQWVLKEACRQVQIWQEQFSELSSLYVSVNLSSKHFIKAEFEQEIKTLLSENQVRPQSLKLEITESTIMDNKLAVAATLAQLQNLGVELSIDDFGTGHSSLSYLHQIPATTIKIDRSFINRMKESSDHCTIVRTIIMLAHKLEMSVVAEGIETNEQAELLKKLECDFGQGYFFSKPLDQRAATTLLSETLENEV